MITNKTTDFYTKLVFYSLRQNTQYIALNARKLKLYLHAFINLNLTQTKTKNKKYLLKFLRIGNTSGLWNNFWLY